MGEYVAMGGHGFYIWACYAVTFIGLALLGGISFRGWKANERERVALEALLASRRPRTKRIAAASCGSAKVR